MVVDVRSGRNTDVADDAVGALPAVVTESCDENSENAK